MTSRLRIRHETRVGYPSPASSSYNEARMSPLTLPTQTVLDSRVTVSPAASQWTYWDYWGTQVTVFDLADPHTSLSLTATSLVETAPPSPLPVPLDRAEIAARSADSRLTEFLAATARTTVGPELAERARAAAAGLDAHQAATALTDLVRARLDYCRGTTGVHSGAQEAWDQQGGVCQDFAHLSVALLRAVGLPARYVSGYLHPAPDAAADGPVAGESHAWVEYWAGAWIGHDPTNGTHPGESHVIVARGREYGDVPPHKGVYRGAPGELPQVRVEFTRLA
ncbi:transglutaminase N-terminal domain-containing protein [Kitasatospora sp. NPDC058965]|uniref:transglutaminase family protein n=1 Tax=Kitasatospora sp. NPDC058965 TaxID=3346682 RepID=UPI0036CCCD76